MNFNGDVVVRIVPLPPGVHGMICEDPDGIANIYINQSDSQEEQLLTLRHELRHYRHHHVGSDRPIHEIEHDAG